jgi:hypothetical protein
MLLDIIGLDSQLPAIEFSPGERVLPVRHEQAISASHLLPVIFVGSSTNETDLIVLAIATESWPSKPMGAKFSEESPQESHVCRSLPHGPDSVAGPVLKNGG